MGKVQTKSAYVLIMALALIVFLSAHWEALNNPYVINDDVRQQLFWMQQWEQPELFQNDLLTSYSKNYVPWGVQAVYYLASPFMAPVDFSKILTGILFVLGALLIFLLGKNLGDDLTGVLLVALYLISNTFLYQISGGLSRAFGFPIMISYVYFLKKEKIAPAALVIVLASLLNPYITLICMMTHAVYVVHTNWSGFVDAFNGQDAEDPNRIGRIGTVFRSIARANWPIFIGFGIILIKYIALKNDSFGALVTWSDMAGKIEYTAAGRYPIIPVPMYIHEIVRPLETILPFWEWGYVPYGLGFAAIVGVWAVAMIYLGPRRLPAYFSFSNLRAFIYLFIGSSLLYWMARWLLMNLFLPRRYMEYSMTLVWVVIIGLCLRVFCEITGRRRFAAYALLAAAAIIGAVRLEGVGLHNYSDNAKLWEYLQHTPSNSIIAGPPDIMDCALTFGKRKALVTYELSHTWYMRYWEEIKERTTDYVKAYYSSDPERIRKFAEKHNVDFIVARESDFSLESVEKRKRIIFEPFDSQIKRVLRDRSYFAILDRNIFPALYEQDGLRLLKVSDSKSKISKAQPGNSTKD